MDNMDDPETNAKISDSAYSNSCSNSQSRRSHSSKSTHSGSNSSGSSGYGGKASTSGSSNNLGQPPKKDKESKKNKLSQTEVKTAEVVPANVPITSPEPKLILATLKEESDNIVESVIALPDQLAEEVIYTRDTDIAKIEASTSLEPETTMEYYVTSRRPSNDSEGFSCVISMHDGVVMYTSASITATLGFPKDVWVGRSFIDFVHPKDHTQFASLITNGLAFPGLEAGNHSARETGLASGTTMVCRIRRYRSLYSAFGVKDVVVTFMPFSLKFFFKDHCDANIKIIYLVIQATHYSSAFKTPNELALHPTSFVIRHAPSGVIDYIDPDSVPYFGYLPQDIKGQNVLDLYHVDDLPYLRQIYEAVIKEGSVSNCKPYRFMVQNGCYIRVETEWSSVINPWSMKLEFVISKHRIIEGPTDPDVFHTPSAVKQKKTEAENYKTQTFIDSIIRIMNKVRTKPAEVAKQLMGKRCRDLVTFMETLIENKPKQKKENGLDSPLLPEREFSSYERDSEMLGGISPHHDSNSKFSTDTSLSYNQLNYNDNLQRYFDSQESQRFEPSSLADSNLTAESKDLYSLFNSSAIEIMVSSPPLPDSRLVKLTEYMMNKISRSTLNKHNAEMEKELVKMHRELRASKEDRDKTFMESKKNKKDHLARCNAAYYPTSAGDAYSQHERADPGRRRRSIGEQLESGKGVKRPAEPQFNDAFSKKHHCPSLREHRPCIHQFATPSCSRPSNVGDMLGVTSTTNVAKVTVEHLPATYSCQATETSGTPSVSVIPGVTGMYPAYYSMPSRTMPTLKQECFPSTSGYQQFQPPLPYMVHGHAIPLMYAAHPVMYSPASQVHPVQQRLLPQTTIKSVSLSASSYGQPHKSRVRTSEEIAEKTDGESSYSSLQSSFFRTDSCSAEDSDQKNKKNEELLAKTMQGQDVMTISSLNMPYPKSQDPITVHRKAAPRNEQLKLNKDLIYKYQIESKPLEEVLREDKEKIMAMEQPSMISEQLSQLYLDLRLQGAEARLTLEEGVTSSSSSGEENTCIKLGVKCKYDFDKLVIIHEENAPLPIPGSGPVAPDTSFAGDCTPSDTAGGTQKRSKINDT